MNVARGALHGAVQANKWKKVQAECVVVSSQQEGHEVRISHRQHHPTSAIETIAVVQPICLDLGMNPTRGAMLDRF